MPAWKKVITSGSDASLNSLNVSSGVTGSLFGTASYAVQALSASYVPSAGLTGGTANYIPLWTSTSAISSSALFQSASNIGINKILPSASLDVTGVIRGMYETDPGNGGSITAKFVSYAPSPFGLLFRGYSI